jgi:hypothetical protein
MKMVATNKNTHEKCMNCKNELVLGEDGIYWMCVKPTFIKGKTN